MMRLSKSQFIRGLQCPKSLWLYKYKPELRQLPDASRQAIFDAGTDVGKLAQQLFPGGEELEFDFKKLSFNIQQTQDLIQSGIQTIYEATFLFDEVLVMVDILHKGPDGWEMYEVKSSTEVKEVHVNDMGIQYYVLAGSGLNVSKAALVHINNTYERHGELDIYSLFTIADLTEILKVNQQNISYNLKQIKLSVQKGSPMPEIDIGPHCSDPYDCDFMEHCWGHIPTPSVFNLANMRSVRKFALYDEGIITFDQIPKDCHLTEAQKIQVEAELKGTSVIDRKEIRDFVQSLDEPVGFLDFETFTQPVPQFDNLRPYQKIPFQYSLHIKENGVLKHCEHLADAGIDPRPEFVKRLISDTEPCSMILVYNQGFEKSVLRQLAEWFPEHVDEIESIIDRIVDLMYVFQKRQYYTREMNGSYSIKTVLPALVPDLSYEGLDIGDGDAAMNAFSALQHITNPDQIQKTRNDLLKYCELDTLAMVEILQKLHEVGSKNRNE